MNKCPKSGEFGRFVEVDYDPSTGHRYYYRFYCDCPLGHLANALDRAEAEMLRSGGNADEVRRVFSGVRSDLMALCRAFGEKVGGGDDEEH